MGIATVKSDLLAFESAWAEKKPGKIIRASSVLLADVADVFELFEAGPNDESDKAECCAIIKRLEAMANQPVAMEANEVGKLFPGDLSVLKALLALIIKLAPLFIAPAPAPAG